MEITNSFFIRENPEFYDSGFSLMVVIYIKLFIKDALEKLKK